MKVAIVGAGAMGSIFGAYLRRAGHDVALVDVSQPLVDRIASEGVTIVRGGEETVTPVAATADAAEVGHVEAVIFCVKCYQTASAAETARPLIGPDTIVASLQNGWGNGDILARVYDPARIVIGVTYNSGTVLEPGRVVHPRHEPTVMGPYEGDSLDGAERLAGALGAAGLHTGVVGTVRTEIWKKLIMNAATLPTAALTGMNAQALTRHPFMHELVTGTAREAIEVARALGHDIDEAERLDAIHGLLGRVGETKPSMLQDFEAGRQTEVDVVNGAVVRAADEVGLVVPLNRTLVALVKGWESTRGVGTG